MRRYFQAKLEDKRLACVLGYSHVIVPHVNMVDDAVSHIGLIHHFDESNQLLRRT